MSLSHNQNIIQIHEPFDEYKSKPNATFAFLFSKLETAVKSSEDQNKVNMF
jgi:hypothetical protein